MASHQFNSRDWWFSGMEFCPGLLTACCFWALSMQPPKSCFLLVHNLCSTVVIYNDSHLNELTWSHFQNQVDSDKDSHSGCQNISQCHHQQKQFACVKLKVLSHSSMPFLKHLISFKVKRPGEENVKCTIMFLLDYQVRGINQMSVVN